MNQKLSDFKRSNYWVGMKQSRVGYLDERETLLQLALNKTIQRIEAAKMFVLFDELSELLRKLNNALAAARFRVTVSAAS
jgi:hypothetical protein